MYVWFDALTSYISTLGWPKDPEGRFQEVLGRGKTLQMAGKDQVRFQSLMWQAMLMSAGIKNTDQVFYHGFINSGRRSMSKSLGNVISPYELVEKIRNGRDPLHPPAPHTSRGGFGCHMGAARRMVYGESRETGSGISSRA
jgi:methionyl-tRNA synthetase